MPTEDEVRDLVRRVVEGVGTAATSMPGGSSATASTSTALTSSTAREAPATGGSGMGEAIAIGADHGGLRLKELLAHSLAEQGYRVHDCGTSRPEPVDYPDFAHAVARLVADGTCAWGIIVDGAGIGSCIAANKVPGVRAALCHDLSTARNSREHNHANVLTLGGRLVGEGLALEIVTTWLATPWGPGRHAARVEKITEIERRYLRDAVGDRAR